MRPRLEGRRQSGMDRLLDGRGPASFQAGSAAVPQLKPAQGVLPGFSFGRGCLPVRAVIAASGALETQPAASDFRAQPGFSCQRLPDAGVSGKPPFSSVYCNKLKINRL